MGQSRAQLLVGQSPLEAKCSFSPNLPHPHFHKGPAQGCNFRVGGEGKSLLKTDLILQMNKQNHKHQGWYGRAPPKQKKPIRKKPRWKISLKTFLKRNLFEYLFFQFLKIFN